MTCCQCYSRGTRRSERVATMGLPRGKSYEGDNDYELKFVRLTENPYRKYADANIRRALEEYGGSKIKTQKAAATSDCNKGAAGKRKREATCNLQLEKPPKEDLYSSSSTSIDSGHIADESSSSETYTHRIHKLKRISHHTSARPLSRSESDSDHRETDEHVKTSLTAETSCSSPQYSGTVKKHRKVSASVSTHSHKPAPPKRKTRSKKSVPKLPSKGSTPVHPSNEVSSKPPSKKSKVLAAAKKIYEEHGMAGLEPVIYVTILITAQMKGISFEEASGLYFCRQNGPKKKCKKRAMRLSRIVYRPVSRKLNRNKVSKKVRNSTVAAEESGTAKAELVYSHKPISLRHYVSPSSSLVGLRSRSTESKFFSGEDVRCPAVEIPQPPASSDRILPDLVSADGAASNAPHTETETRQTQLAELPTARTPPAAIKGIPKSQVVISAPPPQAWNEKLEVCSKLLHAHDYGTIVTLFPRAPAEDVALIFIYSLALLKLGKFSDAKRSFLSCERTANAAGRQSDVALCCVYLGDLELSDQNYDQAGGCYRRAIQYHSVNSVASQFKMVPPSLSSINSKLGSCLRNSSKPVEAIQAYKEAVSDAQTEKDKLSACTSLGNLFQSLGENTQALEQYQLSIDLAVGLQDNVSLGWAHGNMGNAYLGLFQKEKALHHLKQSLDLTVQYEPVPQAIGRAYNNLGTAYQSLGDLDEAEVQYDLALSQAIYGNDIPGQARVYGNIGNVFMLRKEYERAVPHYTEVLRLSRDRSTITTAHHNRGCAYYEWGEHKKKGLYGSPFDDDDENRPPNTKKVAANNNPSSFLRRCEADYDSITSLDDLEPTGKDSSPQAKPSEGANKKVECHYYLHGPDFEHNVEDKHRPHVLVDSVAKYFKHGSGDLEEVITQNEASFKNIKGSSKGFSLSVSLFESNSRTFHRKQDCLVNIGEWKKALAIAEQSRARTLGELMLRKKALVIDHPLNSPLDLAQIEFIVSQQDCPVVYLSYTGARLLCWVLLPLEGKVRMNMFEVPLKDNHFEGKSFDYHLRYNLTETLVERSFEMYRNFRYEEEEQIRPVQDLYDLVAIPLLRILEKFNYKPTSSPKRIVLIPDSYTMLLPFTCLLHDKSFLGDRYYFQIVPSLLSMGILSQLADVVVRLPDDSRSMCVVGNPSIPSFAYNGEEWNLGKLPHAAREAKWVGHILKTAPILDEQATKNAVLMRIMNAKVIHIATHGSASAGFLAFAGLTSSQRNKDIVDSKAVLLYPDEVEKLTISPALVVLSSCDSGRGTVKADGIQGMARAFILAGAQAVLTTLWRVPDESASVFMKLFYQFLVEGFPSSESLQKAILTLRCFSKYSQYIHWSGFQITGRDIRFEVPESVSKPTLDKRLGPSSVFPRLEEVQQFESALVRNPCLPTDVQVLRASPGIKPSEIIIDFLHYNHDAFKGGIFWINGRRPELIEASILYIEQAVDGNLANLQLSEARQAVLVLDAIEGLPSHEALLQLMKNRFVHIFVVFKSCNGPEQLVRDADKQLLRGCKITEVKSLLPIHSTQRVAYRLLRHYHLAPNDKDQAVFENLSEFTSGSPAILETATEVLLCFAKENPENVHDALEKFNKAIKLENGRKQVTANSSMRSHHRPSSAGTARHISENLTRNIPSATRMDSGGGEEDVWDTNTCYDSWDSIAQLIDACRLSREEQLLLYCCSMFSCSPIPVVLVEALASMIAGAAGKKHLAGSLHCRLRDVRLMKLYPHPVILLHGHESSSHNTELEFLYVPQYISRALWSVMLKAPDKAVALATTYKALESLRPGFTSRTSYAAHFYLGMCALLVDMFDLNFELVGRECYQRAYRLYVQLYEDVKVTISNA